MNIALARKRSEWSRGATPFIWPADLWQRQGYSQSSGWASRLCWARRMKSLAPGPPPPKSVAKRLVDLLSVQQKECHVAERPMKMPAKKNSDDEAPEVVSQRASRREDGICSKWTGRRKAPFKTWKLLNRLAEKSKRAFPSSSRGNL